MIQSAAGPGGGEGARFLTADAIARLVSGTLQGPADVTIRGVAPLDRAGPDQVSFFAHRRYAEHFVRSQAGVVLVAPELAEEPQGPTCRIVVRAPHEALLLVLPTLYAAPAAEPGIHATAVLGRGIGLGEGVAIGPYVVIERDARLGDGVVIGAHCHVGEGVEIGAESELRPGVTLYPGARIGRRVRLHAGVRIASDGFGYVFRDGMHAKIPHVGQAIIEDDVEIGANSTVDRGSIDDTVIGAGTRIDNLVHVAHNVRIGRLCLIMAQVGIAGSVRIGDGCVLAGQVGVSGHVVIGDGARLAAQAGVFGDVPAGETWSGYPARPHKESLRAQAAMFKLPALMRRLQSRDGGDEA
ncbi:MAG TPA: UDP-3-O-(3-hydroxymyristoyl)glucosamine N-acyltransferase [Gemmatimonadaceae bacterium]|nr:UDP-3-O-(3-hydroxymyristoyl)glucosamine N-acyltransferase [Gemmatimonadaceae bacterium]